LRRAAAAKEHAKQLADGHEVELWQLITLFKSDNPARRSDDNAG
jgi:hypothetical protein